jgi:gliding motility-associated-like protein
LPVRIMEMFYYYIPNTFTPNADGMNDLFHPFSASEMNYTLSIYNRWGEELFVGENQGWDGKYKGKVVKPDVYAWCLLFSFRLYGVQVAYGSVTVLR